MWNYQKANTGKQVWSCIWAATRYSGFPCQHHRENITYSSLQANYQIAVAHPDLQTRGPSHSDPEIRGGALKKIFYRPVGPQFGPKMRGGPGSPRLIPWIYLCIVPLFPLLPCLFVLFFPLIKILLSLKINLIITIPKKIILNLTIHNGHACWTLSPPKQQCKSLKGIENMCWIALF